MVANEFLPIGSPHDGHNVVKSRGCTPGLTQMFCSSTVVHKKCKRHFDFVLRIHIIMVKIMNSQMPQTEDYFCTNVSGNVS